MLKITKQKNGGFILENEEVLMKLIFNKNKTWMNIKELSKLFGEKKSLIKSTLHTILLDGEFDIIDNVQKVYNFTREQEDKYYSLDLIISLGYRLHSYNETKFIIHSNRIIKEYINNNETPLSSFKKSIKNISKIFLGFQVH